MLSIPTTDLQPEDLAPLEPDALSIDWVRLVFPLNTEKEVRGFATFFAGTEEAEQAPALHNRSEGEKYAKGVRLSWTPVEDQVEAIKRDKAVGPILEVPGEALKRLTYAEVTSVLQHAVYYLGARATRLDLAADYLNGSQANLIEDAKTAAANTCLLRTKTWVPITTYSGSEITGHGVNFGKRGDDGSGRYVRIYDKGLESKTEPIGQWVRWEAEFSGDVARKVLEAITHPDDPADPLALCLGAVEFRSEATTAGQQANAKRRPFCPFYKRLLVSGDPYRFSADRQPSTPTTRRIWAQKVFGRHMANVMEARPDVSVWNVLTALFGCRLDELAIGSPKGSALDWLASLDELVTGNRVPGVALAGGERIGGRS